MVIALRRCHRPHRAAPWGNATARSLRDDDGGFSRSPGSTAPPLPALEEVPLVFDHVPINVKQLSDRKIANVRRVGEHRLESIYYGAWVSRAIDGTFVAELPDFPGVTACGPNMKRVVTLASIRLSAHIASMLQEGKTLPPPTTVSDLLDGCVLRRAVAHILDVREPSIMAPRGEPAI